MWPYLTTSSVRNLNFHGRKLNNKIQDYNYRNFGLKKKLWKLTFASETAGKVSQTSSASSPVLPWRCPESILAAVRVLIPMPSPTKRTTPLASPVGGVVPVLVVEAAARILDSMLLVAASYHTFLSEKSHTRKLQGESWCKACVINLVHILHIYPVY